MPYANLGRPLVTPDLTVGEFRGEWRKVPLWMRAAMWPVLLSFIAVRLMLPRGRLLRQVMGDELNDLPSDLDEALADEPVVQAMTVERDRRLVEALDALHQDMSPEGLTVAVVWKIDGRTAESSQ